MFPLETRILVVDDMPIMRDLVKTQLRAMGYQNLLEAEDGEEALMKVLESDREGKPVQLIISDWKMPNLTGLDFLKQVRSSQRYKNLPFILLTSESEKDQATEAILAGVSQYIVKPFQPKSLEDKLKAVWKKHQGS